MIRRALAHDAAAIEGLYRELVSDPLVSILPEQVAALAESTSSFLLVAESSGTICGSALLNICPDVMYRQQPFGVIENVVVAKVRRGTGIGGMLLAHIEQLALDRDCTKLMLLSGASRMEAHAFFRRCGFYGDTKNAFVKYRRQFALS
jgi:N-acetylglutamate synthase-like GNAT family acetyltransferase